MKKFYRFWFLPGPHSQATSMYVYASDLLEAVEKAEARLKADYGGSATLTARHEEFDLADCNRFAKTSVSVSQCMTPSDIAEICEDLAGIDLATLDIPTRKLAQDFRYQMDAIQCRRGGQLVGAGPSVNKRQR